jgi:hypothetical protein
MAQRGEAADERASAAEYKTRLNSGLDFFKGRGMAPSADFHAWAREPERYPFPDLSAPPLPGSPMAGRQSQTAYRDGPQTANTQSQTQYRDTVQAPATKARTADIATDNKRADDALALRTTQVLNNLAIATQRLANGATRSGSGGGTRPPGARATTTPKGPKGPNQPKAPKARRMTEGEVLAEQARKSGMDVETWKRFKNLGIAPGPQASQTLDFYMKNGLIKPNDAQDVTKGYYIDTRSPWRQNFMDEQARWKNGKNRWKDGRMERVPPRGSDEEVDAFLSNRGR